MSRSVLAAIALLAATSLFAQGEINVSATADTSAKISLNTAKAAKDTITLTKMPLDTSLDYTNFYNVPLSITIEGVEFTMNLAYKWVTSESSKTWTYKYTSTNTNEPTVSLVLDFKKGYWTLKLTKATLGPVDVKDGVDVVMTVSDGTKYLTNLDMSMQATLDFPKK